MFGDGCGPVVSLEIYSDNQSSSAASILEIGRFKSIFADMMSTIFCWSVMYTNPSPKSNSLAIASLAISKTFHGNSTPPI
jgi:hypothetical protein